MGFKVETRTYNMLYSESNKRHGEAVKITWYEKGIKTIYILKRERPNWTSGALISTHSVRIFLTLPKRQ